jgi:hypothetical protein
VETFLVSLVSGLIASALFEVLHNPESRKRYAGVARLSGRLFVSDHNRPRHKAALWAVAGLRWTMVALGAGAGSAVMSGMLNEASAGTVGPNIPSAIALGIASGLYLVTISQSRGYLIRGVAAMITGFGVAVGILRVLGGVPSADEAVTAILVFALAIAFCWRALGLIPVLRH